QNPDVVWHHDARTLDVVAKCAVCRDDSNLVVRIDIAQFAKERIAVTGQPEIAALAGQARAGDVANRQTQRARVASGPDPGRHAETWNFDASYRAAWCEGAPRRSFRGRRHFLIQNLVEFAIFERLIQSCLGVCV